VEFSGEKSAGKPGDAFECIVTFTDDLGHVHQARGSGACWAHDPSKELKSARQVSLGPMTEATHSTMTKRQQS
jgi:hypothetical protein